MRVSLDDLVQRVKTNMEELTDEGSVTVKSGINIETYIQNKMADAVLAVWVSTPLSELPQNDCASDLEPERRSDGSGRVTLPEDVAHDRILYGRVASACDHVYRPHLAAV